MNQFRFVLPTPEREYITFLTSSPLPLPHPRRQVRWVLTEPGEDLCLYSVAQDGRLTQWQVHCSVLIHTDVITFKPDQPRAAQPCQDKVELEGMCFLFLYYIF